MATGTKGKMINYWTRAETGPVCFLKEFDTKRYWQLLKSITKKYGIEFDPTQVVPTDDDLLDSLWKAGLELFLECGILCTDTNRLMLFTEQEVKQCIANIPESTTLGEGKDAITIKYRGFEDYDSGNNPKMVLGRILGPLSDDLFEKIFISYAQEPYMDVCHFQGVISKLYGVDVKANSPFEILAELKRVSIVKDVCRRTGRPGLCDGASTPISLQAEMSAANLGWGATKGDSRNAYIMPHLKTNYSQMCRALNWHQYGMNVLGLMQAYIGGQAGGPANAVVNGVAELIANIMLYEPTVLVTWPTEALYFSNGSLYALFVANFAGAAFSKHTKWPCLWGAAQQLTAGIMSEEYFWESAAGAIGSTCLGFGVSSGAGYQSSGLDQSGGLGVRFVAEVGKAVAAARLTRVQANELVLKCNAKYQAHIDSRTLHTIGGDFRDAYDLETIQPKMEYLAIYEKVKAELREMGLPMA